ncbi:putative MCE family protein [Mycolicibacterium cyprinidarum]|uniref:MCE family protein n=1 Tax=Mycolicibacterium cyprinidarum TaxID=2860311 RepID=A0ABQ4VEZ1_9MYCO|nr:putative MCE family protein [Mycolicibacterium sp. NGTWSNA01]GJF19255.1 putative MCE family protein [Mycolicibacterium sp. NGTWS0302]GJF19640.1 putative MCE family protein [Mycolicibacterium sp. NGTWS1803]
MGNSLDQDGRGPSDGQLLIGGIVVALVIALTVGTLLMKSTGRLDKFVRVVAEMVNVGDGLPKSSDVKYHGLLVGSVSGITPATDGKPNFVNIDLKPRYAKDIPATVTARVVPSNVFAVSSVQLIDNGPAAGIENGARISEDSNLSTVLFQTTISKLRDVLAAVGRGREDHSLGVLAAVGAATENRRVKLLNAGAQLTRLLDQLNAIVATDPADPTTVSALVDAAQGLQSSAPELVDALHQAVKPMQTFVEKRAELTSLVAGSQNTLGVTRQAFDNHTDQLIQITHDLTPVVGVLAMQDDKFVPIFSRVKRLSDQLLDQAWMPDVDTLNVRANLSLTPAYTYTRADCPIYGELKGPSCFTAPEISVRPELPPMMLPQNYQPPPGLAPPPGTVIGPEGNLHAVGPPLINAPTPPVELNQPLPWWTGPSYRVPGTANPDNTPMTPPGPAPLVVPPWLPVPPPPPPPNPLLPVGVPIGSAPAAPQPAAPLPPGPPLAAEAAPASYGGNVGPVGSQQELNQLGLITGQAQPASVVTSLLLGPVARGTEVSLVPAGEGPK